MTASKSLTIRLNAADNVVVSRAEMLPGTNIAAEGITCIEAIPTSHKIATQPIAAGAAVRKYSQIIGFATQDIATGAHVHVHNVSVRDFERDYAYCAEAHDTWSSPREVVHPYS